VAINEVQIRLTEPEKSTFLLQCETEIYVKSHIFLQAEKGSDHKRKG